MKFCHPKQLSGIGLLRSFDPCECLVSDSIVVELHRKALMSHFIKPHAEIKQDSVGLLPLVLSARQVMDCCYKLRFTQSPFPEAMLLVTRDVMTAKYFIR